MADDLKKRGEPDRSRININEPHELEYWTKALKVSEDALRATVKIVGPNATSVRAYLSAASESSRTSKTR